MNWLKINGCDFNLKVAALSFDDFKKEFKDSFCKKRSEAEIKSAWEQLRSAAGITEPFVEEFNRKIEPAEEKSDAKFDPLPEIKDNGDATGNKEKVSKGSGKRSGAGD